MSEVFEVYEHHYWELSANLSSNCTAATVLDGEQKKQKISEIKTGLDDADGLLQKMDLEARSLSPSAKATLLAKLREYKTDFNSLKNESKRLTSTNANLAARDQLLESGMADALLVCMSLSLAKVVSCASTVSNDQRGRLLMTTKRLNQSTDRIKESRRTMLETEELGVSILQNLHQQRQFLLHANNTVCLMLFLFVPINGSLPLGHRFIVIHGVDDNVSRSKKILTSMSRRMSRNKCIIGSIVAILVLAIIFILYFKLTH
ncbi:vesicle transport v-snare 13 [Quercus suber]|uniref:Vesicle transport v-snare 13 n=1 Tax=Quercus suber TaxID=58331 RepID=A0AAW0M4M6_QUESU